MERFKALEVYFDTRKVGTLATYQNRITAFEYSQQWLNNGFSISPFSLPLQKKLFLPKYEPFDGLYGVFADSLPDGWGRLLVDRLLLREQMDPHTVDMLNRLAIVGETGMGALTIALFTNYNPNKRNMTMTEYQRNAEKFWNPNIRKIWICFLHWAALPEVRARKYWSE